MDIVKDRRGGHGRNVGRKKILNNNRKTYSLYLSDEEYRDIKLWIKERRGIKPKELGKMIRKYIDRYLDQNYKCDYKSRIIDLSEKIKVDGLGKYIRFKGGKDDNGELTEMAIRYLHEKL